MATLALFAVNVAAYFFPRWRLDRDHERRLAEATKAEHARFIVAVTAALSSAHAAATRCAGPAPAGRGKEMN